MRKDSMTTRLTPTHVVLCLLVALLVGVLLGLLQVRAQGSTYDPWFNGRWAVPLWFSFVLGVVESLVVIGLLRRVGRRTWLSVAAASLTWMGMTSWWVPIAGREDALYNASCLHRYCHVAGVEGVALLVYLLIGMVLVLLGAVIGSFFLMKLLS